MATNNDLQHPIVQPLLPSRSPLARALVPWQEHLMQAELSWRALLSSPARRPSSPQLLTLRDSLQFRLRWILVADAINASTLFIIIFFSLFFSSFSLHLAFICIVPGCAEHSTIETFLPSWAWNCNTRTYFKNGKGEIYVHTCIHTHSPPFNS